MSEKKESIAEKKISRRSMLKWTGGLAAAAVVGAGIGYEAGLLQPAPPPSAITATVTPTATASATATAAPAEQVVLSTGNLWTYVKNGRIIRIRPARVPESQVQRQWQLVINNKVYDQGPRAGRPRKEPYTLAQRAVVYDPRRVKYPMKRVDWSTTNRNTQNRGKSKFVRISWDEAMTTVASEMKRVVATYGPSAIHQTNFSHGSPSTTLDTLYKGVNFRTLCIAFGGYTAQMHATDSWEGYIYGGSWVWGDVGDFWVSATKTSMEDVLRNSKMIVEWCTDRLGQSAGGTFTPFQPWFRQLGINRVCITSDMNRDAIAYGDTWIPILPGTDGALALAIQNVWITEGTYDKDYVTTHTVGFDKWKDHVTGVDDGVPKTPEWAEKITGIKARTIRALAREWASKPTDVNISTGTFCRTAWGFDTTRQVILTAAMQGLGKPGRGWSNLQEEPPNPSSSWTKPSSVGTAEVWGPITWIANTLTPVNNVKQMIWKTALPDAILNPPISWNGSGLTGIRMPPTGLVPWWGHEKFDTTPLGGPGGTAANGNDQWAIVACPYTYPAKGYSEIHLIIGGGTQLFGCWGMGEKLIQAYQSPKIEFLCKIDIRWGGEGIFSDMILPACTVFERSDASNSGYLQKAIPPMWESRRDFDIEGLLADKLGVLDKVHEGLDDEGWIKRIYNAITISEFMTWDDYRNYTGPANSNYPEGKLPTFFDAPWNPKNAASPPPFRMLGDFADDPTKAANKLHTKSGLIEFEAGWINDWFPNDKSRTPLPRYRTNWEGLQTPLAQKYPLLVESGHPTYRFHTDFNENPWTREIPQSGMLINGYYYESIWINPKDAAARGIQYGDIIRVFNDRGQILGAAYVTERMTPGAINGPDGAWYDPVDPGNPKSLDKGGCTNFLAPHQYQDGSPDFKSSTVPSSTWSAYLAQVEKWTGPVPQSASETRTKEGV